MRACDACCSRAARNLLKKRGWENGTQLVFTGAGKWDAISIHSNPLLRLIPVSVLGKLIASRFPSRARACMRSLMFVVNAANWPRHLAVSVSWGYNRFACQG